MRAEPATLGPCPVCGRPLIEGPSVDRHHLVPRSQGGRLAVALHRICHRKLHALWSERELAARLSTPEAIRAEPAIQAFARWLARKPPEFWVPTDPPRRGRSK